MKLKVLGTGSSGNCYLLQTEAETLILDCGISFDDIVKGLEYNIINVSGVIVSHCHRDHCLSVDKFKKTGIPVFQPYLQEQKIQKKKFGIFNVKTFDLPHDGVENRGFLIEADGQKILYMTDFEYCKYNFLKSRINHMIIECNYQKEYVSKAAVNFSHKVKGHCSLDYTKQFVTDNKTDDLRTVLLIHRGISTTNPIELKKCISEVCGADVKVEVARKGVEMELNITPF